MIDFLKNGNILNGVKMGISVDHLYSILGEPNEIIGDKDYGYLYYEEFRYGYDPSGFICEMSIEFNRFKKKYRLKNLKSNRYGVDLNESFSIGSKTKIHKFIRLLNYLQLKWESNSDSDKDHLVIKIKSGPYIVFDLKNGNPFRISVVNGYQ